MSDEHVEKAIDNLLDGWGIKELMDYAREQMLTWSKTADDEELKQLIKNHGECPACGTTELTIEMGTTYCSCCDWHS